MRTTQMRHFISVSTYDIASFGERSPQEALALGQDKVTDGEAR